MLIPQGMEDKFPGSKPEQCKHLRSICDCGRRFKPTEFTCPICSSARKRCGKTAMVGEDACRSHARGRPLTIYNALAGKVGDSTMEELILSVEQNDVTGEFALAKAALANIVGDIEVGAQVNNSDLLDRIQQFFRIATDYKKFVTGETLNIRMDDQTMVAVRRKFRAFVTALREALDEYVEDESVRLQILSRVQDAAKTLGNHVTLGDVNGRTSD